MPRRFRKKFQLLETLESRQMLAAHILGSSTSYATIQAAINAASAGAIINVDAGTYTESLTVNKSLTLRGANASVDARGTRNNESIVTGVTTANGVGFAFNITANNVTLDGFTVQGETNKNVVTGAGVVMAPGIYGTRFLNNIVQNNVAGMFLANSSASTAAVIQYNVFKNNNNAGANGGRGIYTDGGLSGGNLTNVTIDSNQFLNNRGGSGTTGLESSVAFEAQTAGKQSNIRVTNNTFTNNGKSLLFFNTTGVLIAGNTASGAADWYSGSFRFEGNNHDVTIKNNNIINNPGPGVAVDSNGVPGDNSGFVVTNNNIYNNGTNSTYTVRLGVVYNQSAYVGTFDARNNYWGNASGPSGDGSGTGDGVYGNAYKTVYWHVAKGASELFSPWSTSSNPVGVVIAPSAPSNLNAVAAGTSQINLTWVNTANNATAVKVERSTDNANFSLLATLGATATSYSDASLPAGATYYYRVRATNSAGDSGASNVASATTAASTAPATYLSDLAWTSATSGYNTVQKDKSIVGNTLDLGGVDYAKGIGTHAVSTIVYNLAGAYTTFQSDIGIDTEVDPKGQGSVEFLVIGDGKTLYDSGVMSNDQVQHVNVSLAGVSTLTLKAINGVTDSIDYDHADWAGAVIYGATSAPAAPSNLVATALSASSIKLTWTPGPANITGYAIDRATDGTIFTTVATNVSGSSSTWTDPATLSANTKYYYRIRATNAIGTSPNSTVASATTFAASTTITYVSDLVPTTSTVGWGTIQADKTIVGNTITLRGQTYAKGIGTHAVSSITYNLAGKYSSFISDVGVDDEVKGTGSVIFQVIGDGVVLFDSGVVTNNSPIVTVNVNVANVQTLTLVATNGVPDDIDYDHADWAGARLTATTGGATTLALSAPQTTLTTTTTKKTTTTTQKASLVLV